MAAKTSIPIAAGERLTTKYEFYDLLRAGDASILQMNVARVGGLLEAKKIAGMAEVFSAQIAPHLYNGPIGAAASIQLAACTPNFLIQESIMTFGGFHAELLRQPLQWEDGHLIPSREAGLGVELDMAAVARHAPYTGDRLHLQMDAKPVGIRDVAPAQG